MSDRHLGLTRVIELLEEATQSVPGTIDARTEMAATSVWDSLSKVEFITLVMAVTGIELAADDLENAGTPAELTDVIAGRVRG